MAIPERFKQARIAGWIQSVEAHPERILQLPDQVTQEDITKWLINNGFVFDENAKIGWRRTKGEK